MPKRNLNWPAPRRAPANSAAVCAFCLAALLAALCCGYASFAWAEPRIEHSVNIPDGAPEAPEGFESEDQLRAALAAGEIQLITPSSDTPADVVELRDITFKSIDRVDLKLDLYQPRDADGPSPCVVLIHGGAWSGGNKNDVRFYGLALAQRGYAAASISYRLQGVAKYPAAVEDVKCAVRWLRAHAAEYGIDPERMAAMGQSAGGHLSMMIGYSADERRFDSDCPGGAESSAVQAVVNLYGPTDLQTEFGRTHPAVRGFLDAAFDENPARFAEASPLTYLTEDAPPTLTVHGVIDSVVPIEQADRLAGRLEQLGVPFVYDRLEGWPHVMDIETRLFERTLFLVDRFLREHLTTPAGTLDESAP